MMTHPETGLDATSQRLGPRDNEITARGFMLAHAVLITVITVITLVSDGLDKWPTIPLAALSVAAVTVGFRFDRANGFAPQWVWVAAVACWIPLVAIEPNYLQAMFTMFALTFAVIEWPQAIAGAAVMPAMWAVIEYVNDGSIWEWTVLPFGFWVLCCLMGYWVMRIIAQSEERAALIAELAATRNELAEAQRAEGARAERDRIRRDIHDTIAQGFGSILLHSRSALDDADPERNRRSLQLIEHVASEHLGEARRLVGDGTGQSLGGRTLTEALQRVARADEPTATVHVDGDVLSLSGAIEVTVLRIVQEAVANARKHAGAERIDISLAYTERQLLLDVVDDGIGFGADDAPHPVGGHVGGHGLPGIRQRVEELGGSVVIDSEPGVGTSVSVVLPTGAA